MTDYRKAMEIIETLPIEPVVEKRLVEEASGYILAEDISAPFSMPRFDKSAMDGIALKADDLSEHSVFHVLANITAGSVFDGEITPASCVKIMTGAPVPSGYDTVIRREYLEGYEEGEKIKVVREEKKGSNIAFQGEDFHEGNILFEKGERITPFKAGTLAAVGLKNISVYRRPKTLFFATGDEVYEPGEKLPLSGIFNANASAVIAGLKEQGYPAAYGGIIADEASSLSEAIEKGTHEADVIVFSGGVSEGDLDLIPELIQKQGYSILYHKLNVKPGKPQLLAVKGKTWLMGLPGNPVSTTLSLYLFLLPLLKKISGHQSLFPRLRCGRLLQNGKQLKDRHHFIPVKVIQKDDLSFEMTPVPSNGSGDIHAAALADGFARIPHEEEAYKSKCTEFFFLHE